MFYRKNVSGKERMLRLVAGCLMILCGLVGLKATLLGLLIAGARTMMIWATTQAGSTNPQFGGKRLRRQATAARVNISGNAPVPRASSSAPPDPLPS